MDSPLFHPQLPLNGDELHDPSQVASLAVDLLTKSAGILNRILQIAAAAMAGSETVTAAIQSLQDGPWYTTKPEERLQYLRGGLVHAATASYTNTLPGANKRALHGELVHTSAN